MLDIEWKLYERLKVGMNEIFSLVEDPQTVAAAMAVITNNHKRRLLMKAIKARHR